MSIYLSTFLFLDKDFPFNSYLHFHIPTNCNSASCLLPQFKWTSNIDRYSHLLYREGYIFAKQRVCKEEEKELRCCSGRSWKPLCTHFRSGSSVTHTRTHTPTDDRVCNTRFSTRGGPGGFTGARAKAPTTRLKVGTRFNVVFAFESYFLTLIQTFLFLRMGKQQQLHELWVMLVQDMKCLHFGDYVIVGL